VSNTALFSSMGVCGDVRAARDERVVALKRCRAIFSGGRIRSEFAAHKSHSTRNAQSSVSPNTNAKDIDN